MENEADADTVMELPNAKTSKLMISANVTNLQPGLSTTQGRVIQRKMAKITENTLPDDLNFPISRDNIISMQAKSTSTMNFAVRLMRELFTLEELEGKNISGARGKDRVDPNRVEIIKEIVFQVYRTSPSDRDLVWRCCRKAMDSFMRRMKRERAMKKLQKNKHAALESN
ncbi:BEN domain-containing protein 3 [Desmophyllum pertusum]|uniref:BEN domain-containing protein 3 n=1 Tax=Desmophyllum pertusum TaxID=174260 RepID=A0A9W9YMW1_9CNID|nr:BEN domain-containing protein 3 [Desmophyllum pertusum]